MIDAAQRADLPQRLFQQRKYEDQVFCQYGRTDKQAVDQYVILPFLVTRFLKLNRVSEQVMRHFLEYCLRQ